MSDCQRCYYSENCSFAGSEDCEYFEPVDGEDADAVYAEECRIRAESDTDTVREMGNDWGNAY